LKVSPVPATDYIFVESGKLIREIRFVDIAGQVVLHVEVNGYREEISTTGTNSGVYLLLLVMKEGLEIIIRRIVVSR